MRVSILLATGCLVISCAFIQADSPAPPAGPGPRPCTLCSDQLKNMTPCELECLYRESGPGEMPCGFLSGTALRKHGSKASALLWKGKVFCGDGMVNRWCGHRQAVHARVACEPSWLDGKPSIIMDYRGVSPVVWKNVRDEIRQVGPGLYLGIMYKCHGCDAHQKMFFILEAGCCQ